MTCPACSSETRVSTCRVISGIRYRRRTCSACGHVWNTQEVPVDTLPTEFWRRPGAVPLAELRALRRQRKLEQMRITRERRLAKKAPPEPQPISLTADSPEWLRRIHAKLDA